MRTPQVTHFSFACIRECALRTRSACLTFGTSTLSLTAPTHEGPALGDHRCEDTAQNVSFAVYITLCGVWWRGKCISRLSTEKCARSIHRPRGGSIALAPAHISGRLAGRGGGPGAG